MFDSTINVKLKSVFDKLYLSRNIFDKLKKLLAATEGEGDYTLEKLIERSNLFISSINTIIDNLDVLVSYKSSINFINVSNAAYTANFNGIMISILQYYEIEIINNIVTTIEAMRVVTKLNDSLYKGILDSGDIKMYDEFINTPISDNLSSFIPTDDYFAWMSVRKENTYNEVFNIVSLHMEDIKKIDPLNDDTSDSYTGGINSKNTSHSPAIIDLLINTDGKGFSLSSINSKTGEVYTRIEDNYELDASIGYNDHYHDNEYKTVDNILTTRPKPGLLAIKENNSCNVSIRIHGRFGESSPMNVYSRICGTGDLVKYADGVVDMYKDGPTII